MTQQNQKTPTTLESIFKLLLGFASIVAAVSALLSAFGFLILRANAFLLGVSPSLLHHSVHDYLYEGGAFVSWWVVSIVENPYLWVFFAIFPLFLLSKRFISSSGPFSKITQKLKLSETFQRPWIRWGYIIVAAFILLLFIFKLLPSPEAKDLLFATDNHQEIQKRATKGGLEELESRYVYNTLFCIILSGLILLGINKIHKESEKKSLSTLNYGGASPIRSIQEAKIQRRVKRVFTIGRLFLYLLFAVELILLPINYGQSVYTNSFHRVELIIDEKVQKDAKLQEGLLKSINVWLLKETPDFFIIYFDGAAKSVRLIQQSQVLSLSITGRQNIFSNLLLFSIELKFQTNLDNGNISDDLRQAFEKYVSFSQNATVLIEEKGNKWLVIDEDNNQAYAVRKDENKLNIYRVFGRAAQGHKYGLRK